MILTISNTLKMVRRELENNPDVNVVKKDRYSNECLSEIDALLGAVDNIFLAGGFISDDQASEAVRKVQQADSLVNLFGVYLGQVPNIPASHNLKISALNLTNVSTWLHSTLIPWIKGLGSALWAFLSQRLNVREWKVSGGVNNALGLINASLEMTFDTLQPTVGGGQGTP